MTWRQLADTLLPDACVVCGMPLAPRLPHLVCAHCWQAMPEMLTTCPICEALLAAPALHRCRGSGSGSGSGSAIVLAPYPHQDLARYLVHELKYQHNLRAGATLVALMLEALPWAYQHDVLPQALCPVPLSWRARWKRGFNQAEFVARELARAQGLRLLVRGLRRRHGPRQVSRTRRQRLKLPASAFSVRSGNLPGHIAIVDDVYTTGATTRALRRALRQAGAARVDIWCVTRAA